MHFLENNIFKTNRFTTASSVLRKSFRFGHIPGLDFRWLIPLWKEIISARVCVIFRKSVFLCIRITPKIVFGTIMQHTSRTLMESELNLLISAKNIANYVFSARVTAPETTFGAHKIIVHSSRRSRRGLDN